MFDELFLTVSFDKLLEVIDDVVLILEVLLINKKSKIVFLLLIGL
jgi:hypothetical protein